MIDPSSSEYDSDEDDAIDTGGNVEPCPAERNKSPSRADTKSITSNQGPLADIAAVGKGSSPSPSITSEDIEARAHLQEEEGRRMRLQLYVFVLRCIAYPFNAKQATEMKSRENKVNKQQLQTIKERFQNFLKGQTQIIADEAFCNAVQDFYDIVLKSDRVARMVTSGGCSDVDFQKVFRSNIEKRVRQMPEISGLSKETVLSSWVVKFGAIYRGEEESRRSNNRLSNASVLEPVLSKEQLYDMFQNILGVKKVEHQLLYNACQLDNNDEQAAAIRRELNGRMVAADKIENNNLFPKFFCRNNEIEHQLKDQYINELRQQVNLLRSNLEALPLIRGPEKTSSRLPRLTTSVLDQASEDDNTLSKSDIDLRFSIEIVVVEVKGLKSVAAHKIVYCTMEVEGCEKKQTDQTEASKPFWNSQGDFVTTQPLPVVKVKLLSENNGMLAIEDKELGKVIIHPNPNTPKTPDWYTMTVPKNSQDSDVSQYAFAMCSYPDRKSEPNELLQLDGFTVDYSEPEPNREGGRAFFNALKEGENVIFASDDEQDRILWVQAIYRATGQSHKPVPPVPIQKLSDKSNKQAQVDAPISQFHADRARKHGMDEFIAADPSRYDHSSLFELLQRLTLSHRLGDSFSCLGWLSTGQVFVLDEYCSRYGVRGCHRHLCFLSDLLQRASEGAMVDSNLLHYSYAFAASHIHGNRPDGIGTVTLDEKHRFTEIQEGLKVHLMNQITHFRYCFPFGRPDGALKATLLLLERVMMKDLVTPVNNDELRAVISSCLEKAALVNYSRVSEYGKIEENLNKEGVSPKQKLDVIVHLAELCIEVVQQNEEHHADAMAWFSDIMIRHSDTFLSLFGVDMDAVLEQQIPDTWDSFPLFQILNDFLLQHPTLHQGEFHKHLQDAFAPLVIRYIDLMETSIAQSIHSGFSKAAWSAQNDFGISTILKSSQMSGAQMNKKQGQSMASTILWQLEMLQTFIRNLNWPPTTFGRHVQHRLKLMTSSMIQSMISRKQTPKLCEPGLDPGEVHHIYHTAVEEVVESTFQAIEETLVDKLIKVLELLLNKLSRYDEGSFTASLLSLSKPGMELADGYVEFMRVNQDILREKIVDEYFVEKLFERWYKRSVKILRNWLADRSELHVHQLKILIRVFKKLYKDFELQGVLDIRNDNYEAIHKRLMVEEATKSVTSSGALGNNITMKDSDEEYEKDD